MKKMRIAAGVMCTVMIMSAGVFAAETDGELRPMLVSANPISAEVKAPDVYKRQECGCRYIPMSDEAYESFYNILSNRKKQKKEVMIDGYAGFILLDKNGNPKVAMHVQKVVQRLCEKYNEENIIPLPRITPHVFRHTFCTNMANAGMDLKSLQYLMGHSDASVTLNVYTHNSYEKAEESMAQIVAFSGRQTKQENLRRFG